MGRNSYINQSRMVYPGRAKMTGGRVVEIEQKYLSDQTQSEPVRVLFGRDVLPSTLISPMGNMEVIEEESGGKGKGGGAGSKKYYAQIGVCICNGKVDFLNAIYNGDEKIVEFAEGFSLDVDPESGEYYNSIQTEYGDLRIYNGGDYPNQPRDSIYNPESSFYHQILIGIDEAGNKDYLPDIHPAYKGLCYAVSNRFYLGTSNTNLNIRFELTSIPHLFKNDIIDFKENNLSVQLPSVEDLKNNIIEQAEYGDTYIPLIVWEILRNSNWGAGLSVEDLDAVSFYEAQMICQNEGIFVSACIDSDDEIKDIISGLLEYIDGVLYITRDGKLGLKLVRYSEEKDQNNEYIVCTERFLANEPTLELESESESWAITKLEFTDRANSYENTTEVYENPLFYSGIGTKPFKKFSFPYVKEREVAAKLVKRIGLKGADRSFHVNLSVMPDFGSSIEVGDLMHLKYDKMGIDKMLLRVNGVSSISSKDRVVELDCISENICYMDMQDIALSTYIPYKEIDPNAYEERTAENRRLGYFPCRALFAGGNGLACFSSAGNYQINSVAGVRYRISQFNRKEVDNNGTYEPIEGDCGSDYFENLSQLINNKGDGCQYTGEQFKTGLIPRGDENTDYNLTGQYSLIQVLANINEWSFSNSYSGFSFKFKVSVKKRESALLEQIIGRIGQKVESEDGDKNSENSSCVLVTRAWNADGSPRGFLDGVAVNVTGGRRLESNTNDIYELDCVPCYTEEKWMFNGISTAGKEVILPGSVGYIYDSKNQPLFYNDNGRGYGLWLSNSQGQANDSNGWRITDVRNFEVYFNIDNRDQLTENSVDYQSFRFAHRIKEDGSSEFKIALLEIPPKNYDDGKIKVNITGDDEFIKEQVENALSQGGELFREVFSEGEWTDIDTCWGECLQPSLAVFPAESEEDEPIIQENPGVVVSAGSEEEAKEIVESDPNLFGKEIMWTDTSTGKVYYWDWNNHEWIYQYTVEPQDYQIDFDSIPTGTTDNTVAKGDHTHRTIHVLSEKGKSEDSVYKITLEGKGFDGFVIFEAELENDLNRYCELPSGADLGREVVCVCGNKLSEGVACINVKAPNGEKIIDNLTNTIESVEVAQGSMGIFCKIDIGVWRAIRIATLNF